MISGAQCHAARVLVEISRHRLAERSGINLAVIEQFEQKLALPEPEEIATLRASLEEIGADFIPDDGKSGAGVRLKFSRSLTRRISTWEGEGGTAASDDVP